MNLLAASITMPLEICVAAMAMTSKYVCGGRPLGA
jgi:hypothetical protein